MQPQISRQVLDRHQFIISHITEALCVFRGCFILDVGVWGQKHNCAPLLNFASRELGACMDQTTAHGLFVARSLGRLDSDDLGYQRISGSSVYGCERQCARRAGVVLLTAGGGVAEIVGA
jgi:hypothetical protein